MKTLKHVLGLITNENKRRYSLTKRQISARDPADAQREKTGKAHKQVSTAPVLVLPPHPSPAGRMLIAA